MADIRAKTTRQVFSHEGVVMLEVCFTVLEAEDPLWQSLCEGHNRRQKEILQKAEQYLLPKQIDEYQKSQDPRKRFAFPRLTLASTLSSLDVSGEVLSVLWQFRLHKRGETETKRELSLRLSPKGKHVPPSPFPKKQRAKRAKRSIGRRDLHKFPT